MSPASPKPINPWVVTAAVMLATFMEILDTTVVNVSVPHIAGNLGATVDEGTWVVTSYLVSNAIVLPMAGWLANRLGRRRMLMMCVTGFTLTSLLCGMATSLEWLIFFRVLQGLHRRRLAAASAGRPAGDVSAQEAWHRHGGVWAGHHSRAHPGADARRLHYRQFHLALDLLSQPAGGHLLADDDECLRARSSLHRQEQEGWHRSVGHWIPRARVRHVAGGARHRPTQGLVRQPADSRSGRSSVYSVWSRWSSAS